MSARSDIVDFIKSRIALYRSYVGDEEKEIPGLWKDRGNVRMAKRIISHYNYILKGMKEEK